MLNFLIAIFATWRLSAMLSYETGPFDIFIKVREFAGIMHDDNGEKVDSNGSFFAELLDCVWCVSVWIGVFTGLIVWFCPVLVVLFLPFAFSAGAILIERLARG